MGNPLSNSKLEKEPLLPKTKHDIQNSTSSEPTSSTDEDNHDNIRGYIYMACASFGYATMALMVRASESRYDMPPIKAVFIRGLIQSILALGMIPSTIGFQTAFQPIDRRTFRLLFLRGCAGTASLLAVYLALQRLPVGDAQTILFSSPVFVLVLSFIFLHEPVTTFDAIAAVISIAGVVLVIRPYSGHDVIPPATRISGSLFALLAALGSSIAYVSIRKLSAIVHFLVSVLAFGIVSFITALFLGGAVSLDFILSNQTGFLLVVLSSVFAFLGQCFITKGLQYCKAGPGVLVRTIDVPILYLLGLLFLDEVPNAFRLIGSGLVLSAVVAIGLKRAMKSS